MKPKSQRLTNPGLFGILVTLLCVTSSAHAATRTWDGGGTNDNWTTTTNWVGDVAPIVGDDLVFPGGAARLTNTNDFAANTTFNSITFTGSGYTLRGAAVAMNGEIRAGHLTGGNAIQTAILLIANLTVTVTNAFTSLILQAGIDTNGRELSLGGDGLTQVQGAISGGGGLTKFGPGMAWLSGDNTYSGITIVKEGFLDVYADTALGTVGSVTVVSNGATLRYGNGVTVPEPLILAGKLGTSDAFGLALNTGTGPITLTATNSVIDAVSAPLRLADFISGTGGLNKSGSGVLTLSRNNPYTGNTTNFAGTLLVNGNQPQSAVYLSGGTLGGTGTVGTVTAISGIAKTLNPGGSPGILTSSNVTLNSSTMFAPELNGTTPGSGHDQLIVNGTVALNNATFSASLGFTPLGGETFVLINNDGSDAVNGTFSGLAEGATLTFGTNQFQISYVGGTGNDVVLRNAYVPFTGVTRTWDGGGTNGHWTEPQNWAGDVTPVAGDNLRFPASAVQLSCTNDFPSGTTFNSITVSGTNYVLRGTNLALNAGIYVTNAAFATAFFIPLTLNSNQTITASNAPLPTLFGAIDTNGKDLTFAGNGAGQVNSAISGGGGLIKTGPQTLSLNASNSYTGATVVQEGYLLVGNADALGSASAGTTVAAGANLTVFAGSPVPEPLTLSGTLQSLAFLTPVTWSGPVTISGSSAEIATGDEAPILISGAISGSGNLSKTLSDRLTLTANNSYSGTITVNDGVLVVNGAQSASAVVLSSGSLWGTGTAGTITSTGVSSKGVAPGTSPGILTSSNVAFDSSTSLGIELNGTTPGSGHDQLNVAGSVNLGGCALTTSVGFTPAIGNSFTVINNDGSDAVSGTFAGLPPGALRTNGAVILQINYAGGTGNDVVLTRVNPPSKLTSITAAPGGPAQLQGAGVSNLIYTIQAAANLNPVIQWSNVGTATASPSGVFTFTDTNAPLFPMRFYRALSP